MLFTKNVTILSKYLDFIDEFLKKSVLKLFKSLDIYEYTINLKKGKKQLYRLIYSFGFIELESFKIYIKTNLANKFIQLFKSST